MDCPVRQRMLLYILIFVMAVSALAFNPDSRRYPTLASCVQPLAYRIFFSLLTLN